MLSNFYEDGNFVLDYIQDATLYNCKLNYCFLEDLYINNSPIGLIAPNEARFTNITVNNILVTNGNIGIGVANPGWSLDVDGDINFSGVLRKNGVPVYTSGGGTGGNGSTSVFLTRSAQSIGTQIISSGSNILKFPDNENSSGQIHYTSSGVSQGSFYVTLEGLYSIFVDVDFYNANRAVDLYILKNGVEDSSEGRIAWVNCPANDAATINANVYLKNGEFITVNIYNSGDSFTTPYANNKVNSFAMALFNSSQWQGDFGNPISYTAASVTMRDTIITNGLITNLTVDNVLVSNGNVGIGGIADPDYKLDVFGDINFTGDLLKDGNLYLPRPVYVTRSAQTKDAQTITNGDNILKFPDSGQNTGDITYSAPTGRFTVNQEGLYSIFVDVDFYNADKSIDLYILKNGVEDSINGRIAWINCPANDATSINAMVYLEESDYITVVVKNNSPISFTTPYESNKVNSFAMALMNSSSSPRASQWIGDIGQTISYTSGTTLMTNASVSNITIGNGLVTGNLRAISNSNTVGALFTTGGNIGIGNSSPIGRLHTVMDSATVNGSPGLWDSTYAVFGQASASGGAVGLGYHAVSGGSLSSITPGIAWRRMVYRADSHNFFAQGDNQRMIINNSGNIGINNTSPGERLQVSGNLRIGSNTQENYIAFFGTNGDNPGGFDHTYIGERIYDVGTEKSELLLFKGNDYASVVGPERIRLLAGEHRFDTYTSPLSGTFSAVGSAASNNRMIITNSGNVGIGTTTPEYSLDIRTSVTNTTYRGWTIFYQFNNTPANGLTGPDTSGFNGGSVSLFASEAIWTSNRFVVSSDERIKKNIVDIDNSESLNKLRLLKPREYNYKDITKGSQKNYGFIAQEVKKVFPYAVSLQKEIIPNIYTIATVGNNGKYIMFPNTIDLLSLQNQSTDGNILIPIKCYLDEKDTIKKTNIINIIDSNTAEIDSVITSENIIFVYGQEINDFHVLNNDAIWTLSVGALKQMDEELQNEKLKNIILEKKINSLEQRLTAAGL